MSVKDFYCVFVRTEMNLIAFSDPPNSVNTQYAALSGALDIRARGGLRVGCRLVVGEAFHGFLETG